MVACMSATEILAYYVSYGVVREWCVQDVTANDVVHEWSNHRDSSPHAMDCCAEQGMAHRGIENREELVVVR